MEEARERQRRRIAASIIGFAAFIAIVFYVTGLFHTLSGGGALREENRQAAATFEHGFQNVFMEQHANGYNPNDIIVKRGIPVRWVIDSKSPYTCAAYLVVPELGIRKFLKPGENIIEFTPEEEGEIAWSCTGDLYSGKFTVEE